MYLCCSESLSLFKSILDFLRIFKVAPKSDQIVQGHWPKCVKKHFYNFFLIHIHVLMLLRKFELILIKIEFFMNF